MKILCHPIHMKLILKRSWSIASASNAKCCPTPHIPVAVKILVPIFILMTLFVLVYLLPFEIFLAYRGGQGAVLLWRALTLSSVSTFNIHIDFRYLGL
jgi:hypothetical protein